MPPAPLRRLHPTWFIKDVVEEIVSRGNGVNGWYDPHNRGIYLPSWMTFSSFWSSSYLSHARKYVRTIFFTRLQRQQLNSGWRCPPLLPSILCMVAICFARVHVCLPKIMELKRIFNYVLEIRHVHYWLFKRRKRERAPKVSWLTGNNWIGRPKMPASCAL